MPSPIRWDNVNGPALSEASRPLELARQTFSDAFGQLGGVLKEREALEASNWQNTKTNNTNSFLDAVARYRTPEELQAAQASGALDQLRAGYGNQIDATAARGAADQRLTQVMQQAKMNMEYQHMAADERTAPLADAFKAAALRGDTAAAQAAQAQYQQMGGRDLAGLVGFMDQRNQTVKERGRGDTRFEWEGVQEKDRGRKLEADLRSTDADIIYKRASAASAAASAQASLQNAATNAKQASLQERMTDYQIATGTQDRENAKLVGRAQATKNALKEAGNMYAGGVYDGSQAPDLMKEMVAAGIGDDNAERQAMIKRLSDLQRKGVMIKSPDGKSSIKINDLPLSEVRAALLGSKDQVMNGWNQGWANSFEENLKASLGAARLVKNAKGQDVLSYTAVDDLDAFKQAMNNARVNAPPVMPTKAKNPFGNK